MRITITKIKITKIDKKLDQISVLNSFASSDAGSPNLDKNAGHCNRRIQQYNKPNSHI